MKFIKIILLALILTFTSCHKKYDQFYVENTYWHQTTYPSGDSNIDVSFTIYNNYYYTVQDYIFIVIYLAEDGHWESYENWGNYIGDHTYLKPPNHDLENDSEIIRVYLEVYEIRQNCNCYYGCHTPIYHREFYAR